MGYAVTLAVVPLERREAFLADAGVTVTDRLDPHAEAPLSAGEVRAFFLIWRNLRMVPLQSEPDWPGLSRVAPLHVLDVVDSAGAQMLTYYENGEERWVIEGSDMHEDFLGITGVPPHDIDAVRQRIIDEMRERFPDVPEDPDEVAAYNTEIPARVFSDITGFNHEDGPFEGLHALSGDVPLLSMSGKRKDPNAKPWWKIW